MYIQYIYIIIYNIMLLYDSISTCTSFSMSRYKGFAFLYQFSMLFGPNRLIVRISVQSHPEIPGERKGISRIMYLYPRPISDRGDSGMFPYRLYHYLCRTLSISPCFGGCNLSQVAGAGSFASSPSPGEKRHGELWIEFFGTCSVFGSVSKPCTLGEHQNSL